MIKRLSVVLYWVVLLALLCLFFTNDFGILDLNKTTIIVAVGVDYVEEDKEVQVTAKVAVPKPSQTGENIEYTEVQGSGVTVADALNEINAKTGTYPKLLLCKLILIGDSCKDVELFRLIGCFYRKNFSELTAHVAMCEGKASEMIAKQSALGDKDGSAIQQVLSDELKKSANVSAVNLKDIALTNFSKSEACYMPYIQANKQGTSQSGGDGDSVGGENAGGSSGGESSGGSSGGGGEQGGGGGGQDGGSSGSGSSGQSDGAQQQAETVEFTARKTALFSNGKFAAILDEKQSFALDLIENEIRLAVVPCDADGKHYTVGMKNVSGGVNLKVENGVPKLTFSFNAKAQIQGAAIITRPEQTKNDDVVPEEVLKGAEEEIKQRFDELISVMRENDCDVLGIKELLYKYNTKYYEAFKDDILNRMKVEYDIKIKSIS